MRFLLIDTDYERTIGNDADQVPIIRLFGVNIETKRLTMIKIVNFYAYFYVKCSTDQINLIFGKKKQLIHSIEEVSRTKYFGGEKVDIAKIILKQPWLVPKLRELFLKEKYEVFEADIPFNKRFLIDMGLKTFTCYDIPNEVTMDCQQVKDFHIIPCEDYFSYLMTMAVDIEVDEQGKTIQELLAAKEGRITAISCTYGITEYNSQSKVFILSDNSDVAEKKLLQRFIDFFHEIDPCILISFNGTAFDWPYICARMRKHNLPLTQFSVSSDVIYLESTPVEYYRVRGRLNIDLVPFTWHIHPLSGKKGLDDIARLLLGETKVTITERLGILWHDAVIKKDREKLRLFQQYSMQDAILTYKLYWKLQVPNQVTLIKIAGYPAVEGIHSTGRNIGEFELLRLLYRNNIIIPEKPGKEELRQRKEYAKKYPHVGGYVITPNESIVDQVVICDFLSMYPSLIQTHNIGGEVLKPNAHELPAKERFFQDRQACLALLEQSLLEERRKVKEQIKNEKKTKNRKETLERLDQQQLSIKLMANSLYGAHNYIQGRFYSGILSNSITELGHEYIKQLEAWTQEFENPDYSLSVIYGDTDSVFVKYSKTDFIAKLRVSSSPEEVQKVYNEVQKYLKAMNSKMASSMNLELDDIAIRIIFKPGRKKAYSFMSIEGEIIIKGFEAVRSDWSHFAREAQRGLLELLLKQAVIDVHQARKFLLDYCKIMLRLSEAEFLEKGTIMGNIRRIPAKYKAKTPVIGAFLHHCRQIGMQPQKLWTEYDRFPYVIESVPAKLLADKARHPLYSHKVDRYFYIREVLRTAERFNILVTEEQIKFYVHDGPLLRFFYSV